MFRWLKEFFRFKCRANQTQIAIVFDFMKRRGSISTIEARELGIPHLRSIICRMNKKGYRIKNVNNHGRCGVYKFR